MGIDRKDVRVVCHFNIPKSMEAFYQESGRAGRDQLPSRSLLYYGIDDRRRMEFILSKDEGKKSQSSGLQDGLSKRSLTDFKQVVEYCEGSGCRRKKILENFGEQVPPSLCRKSCDACKHPNLVAKSLEELTSTCSVRQRNGFSPIFISSASNTIDDTEFWNRDDEASDCEDDISDSDDDAELVKNLSGSKLQSKSGLNEKIEFLQRAEENYYHNKNPNKEITRPDKNAITETLRETSKQRLFNSLKQTQQRLCDLNFDLERSATFLEEECYKKYGKSGKSFYYSQVASTVRWLSTTNLAELTSRLGTSIGSTSENITSKPDLSPISSSLLNQESTEASAKKVDQRGRSLNTSSPMQTSSQDLKLPSIPSFSEFANRKKPRMQ